MKEPSEVDVPRKTWELIRLLQDSEDPDEWTTISTELAMSLIAYWDVYPHSAKEAVGTDCARPAYRFSRPTRP